MRIERKPAGALLEFALSGCARGGSRRLLDASRPRGFDSGCARGGSRRLLDANRWFRTSFGPPKWGARKRYLLSPQPESGRCRLQVTLLDVEIQENLPNKHLRGLPGATKQAIELYNERFGGGS